MDNVVASGEGRIGLDVGTSKIMSIRQNGNQLKASTETNAFLPLPYSRITENILLQNKVHYYQNNGHFFVYGNNAEKFAGLFNAETRRPMSGGLINPNEPAALTLIKVIIEGLVKKPKTKDDLVCYSVPGAPADMPTDLIYHEQLLKGYLTELGYKSKSVNEGQAIIFSELEKENFTGIGISAGGGMCNACLAYLSVPVVSFSTSKAGDFIDKSVGSVTGESATRVKMIQGTVARPRALSQRQARRSAPYLLRRSHPHSHHHSQRSGEQDVDGGAPARQGVACRSRRRHGTTQRLS